MCQPPDWNGSEELPQTVFRRSSWRGAIDKNHRRGLVRGALQKLPPDFTMILLTFEQQYDRLLFQAAKQESSQGCFVLCRICEEKTLNVLHNCSDE
jgi:hypothetical protein